MNVETEAQMNLKIMTSIYVEMNAEIVEVFVKVELKSSLQWK